MRSIVKRRKGLRSHFGTLHSASLLLVFFLIALFTPWDSQCATVQNFDGLGSYYYTIGPAYVESGGPSGMFMRLVPAQNGQNGALYFNTTDPVPARKIVAEFDFRIYSGSRADGFSITFLNTAHYPDGTAPGSFLWEEEPMFTASLGIGFDIYQNWEPGDPNNNHLNVYFDSQKISDISFISYDLWKYQEPGFDHARIIADLLAGKVSIYVTPHGGTEFAAVENLSVPGLTPYKARVTFAARTGSRNANHDIDNINVTFHPVPLPPTLPLVASGLLWIVRIRRRVK